MQKITTVSTSDIEGATQDAARFFAKKQEAVTPPTQNQKHKKNTGANQPSQSTKNNPSRCSDSSEKSSTPETLAKTPTDREQINRALIATAQQAIAVGRKHDWLCPLEFQPILENLTPEQRNQLDPSEKITLARARHARNRLIELNLRLVKRIAANTIRKASRKVDLQDLIQEGTFGLIRAAEKFDLARNIKFATYAYKWVGLYCQKSVTQEERIISLPKEARSLIVRYKKGVLDPQSRTYEKDLEKAKAWEVAYPHPVLFSQVTHRSDNGGHQEDFEFTIADPRTHEWRVDQNRENIATIATIRDLLERLSLEQRLVIEIKYGLGSQPPIASTQRIMRRLKELHPPPIDHRTICRASIDKWEAEAMEILRESIEN